MNRFLVGAACAALVLGLRPAVALCQLPVAASSANTGAGRWEYPLGRLPDPVRPPAALYSGEGFPVLEISSIYDGGFPDRARAIAHVGGRDRQRRLVRVGDRIGAYRIRAIQRDTVYAVLRSLGTDREVAVPVSRRTSPQP